MVLDELKKLGIDDNTVIILSSDNGYFNGSHGLGSKVLPYEESVRCPLIIADPRDKKVAKKGNTNTLSANVDIPATILDIAGVEIPKEYDGKSLLPVLDNPKKSVRTSVPITQVWGPDTTHCFSVVDQQYKYVYWYFEDTNNDLHPTEELFDLKKDPFEMVNVATDKKYNSALKKMRIKYDKQLAHWKNEGVKYNGYEKYGVLFDRELPWQQKEKTLKEGKKKVKPIRNW